MNTSGLSNRPITITGKTDGFGAQLQAQMSGIVFALSHGRQYLHTPMGPKMDHLEDGVAASDYDQFGAMGAFSKARERGDVEERDYAAEVHNADSAGVDRYYSEDMCALLRRKYLRCTELPTP